MPFYIAQEYGDQIVGCVLAENEKLANAYFQGQDIYPHHYRILSEDDLINHPTGVIPVFKVQHLKSWEVGDSGVDRAINP